MKNTLKIFGVCSFPTLLKRERREVVGNKYNKLMDPQIRLEMIHFLVGHFVGFQNPYITRERQHL